MRLRYPATLLLLRPDRVAEYCDERVCLSVCVCVYVCVCVFVCLSIIIPSEQRPIFTNFYVHVTFGRGSVLL